MILQDVFISLGSNSGTREAFLESARRELGSLAGVIQKASSIYETAPWGKTDQPLFLNQVIQISSSLDPNMLMELFLKVEKMSGRVRASERWVERTLDIDLLFYGSLAIDTPVLQVPHPEIPSRRFILVPLNEIAPKFLHPVSRKTIAHLLTECADHLPVYKWSKQ
jgi:2-amino-4-hydroxy-6-hydroxymethyldihydropteridine diphosphokinase